MHTIVGLIFSGGKYHYTQVLSNPIIYIAIIPIFHIYPNFLFWDKSGKKFHYDNRKSWDKEHRTLMCTYIEYRLKASDISVGRG